MSVKAVNSEGSVSIQTVVMSAQSRPHCLTEPAPTVPSTGGHLRIPRVSSRDSPGDTSFVNTTGADESSNGRSINLKCRPLQSTGNGGVRVRWGHLCTQLMSTEARKSP